MKQLTESEVLRQAAAYCSTAERCKKDIEKKWAGCIEPDRLSRILERLVKENFINEKRFCLSFAHDKFRFNQWGRIKIEYELKRKNISPEDIREALDSLDNGAYEAELERLLMERKKTLKGKTPRESYQKLFRLAAGKGFESQLISRKLKRIFKEIEDDVDGLE